LNTSILFVFSIIFSNAFCTFLHQRYTETFIVSSDLVGRAIGSHGSNIRKARNIPGVSSVDTVDCDDGGYRFYVHGEVNIT